MSDNEMFAIASEALDNDSEYAQYKETIKVIGVGGAGGNALNTIIESNIEDVDFIAANTDVAALSRSLADTKLILGKELTKGRGAGSKPMVGEKAAEESREDIAEALKGADMVFITCGMGGGTGTGASPVVAQIAKEELDALVVAVVSYPFSWEGTVRRANADTGIEKLREKVDAFVIVPNDRLLENTTEATTVPEAHKISDEVLRQAVMGVTGVIRNVTQVNVDYADVCSVMTGAGKAIMGVGVGEGENAAVDAARAALRGPLMTIPASGASAVLYSIEGGENLPFSAMNEAAKLIIASTVKDADIITGWGVDPSLGDKVRVTLIATGFKEEGNPLEAIDGAISDGTSGNSMFEKTPLTAGDVVSGGSSNSKNIFGSLGSLGKGLDIPTALRRKK